MKQWLLRPQRVFIRFGLPLSALFEHAATCAFEVLGLGAMEQRQMHVRSTGAEVQ
jgi:hypothetical protein